MVFISFKSVQGLFLNEKMFPCFRVLLWSIAILPLPGPIHLWLYAIKRVQLCIYRIYNLHRVCIFLPSTNIFVFNDLQPYENGQIISFWCWSIAFRPLSGHIQPCGYTIKRVNSYIYIPSTTYIEYGRSFPSPDIIVFIDSRPFKNGKIISFWLCLRC